MKRITLFALGVALIAAAPAVRHMQLTKAERESEFPCITWNGSKLGLAWMDGRDGNQEIYFNTANMNTGKKGPERRLTSSADWDDHPKLCWTGSEYGLAWVHERRSKFDLMFMRIDQSGSSKGGAERLVSNAPIGKDTAICWTGNGYGIVTTRFKGENLGDLEFRFVDEKGKVQGDANTLTSGPGAKVPAAMLRSGPNFALIFHNSCDDSIYRLKIDPFGRIRGEPERLNLPGSPCAFPDATSGPEGYIVAWPQKAGSGHQVIVAPFTAGDQPKSDPFPVTEPGPKRPSVAVASAGSGFGAAWIEVGEKGRTLYFLKLDGKGKPAYSKPLRLSKPRPVRVMSNRLDMAVDGQGYVMAWVDVAPPMNTEVILSRVGVSGDY